MKKESIRISKFLSYVLRHNPRAIALHLDKEGWASVDELISCAARDRWNLNLEKLKEIIVRNDKGRFSLSPDGQRIRANYGHSINIELGLEPVMPPPVLYHGTAERTIPSILKKGLRPSGRRYVHLSPDIETAVRVSKRHGKPAVLGINSKRMDEDGYKFYCPVDKIWLADCVPVGYLVQMNAGGKGKSLEMQKWKQNMKSS